jgi:uncharacterized membrane protein YkoI
MHANNYLPRLLSTLLLCCHLLLLGSVAWGVSLQGIKVTIQEKEEKHIESLKNPGEDSSKTINKLTELLGKKISQTKASVETLEICTDEEVREKDQQQDVEHDTQVSENVKQIRQKIEETEAYQHGQRNTPGDISGKSIFKATDVYAEQDLPLRTTTLCRELALDACEMANSHKSEGTRERTTCLCVVLWNSHDNYGRRLAFCNGIAFPSHVKKFNTENKKDDHLYGKYQLVDNKPSNNTGGHAETKLIDFLLNCKKRYTHLLGVGCSRPHCKECDVLFQVLLGCDYHQFTAAMKKTTSNDVAPTFERNEDNKLNMKIAQEQHTFEVQEGKTAVRTHSSTSDMYPLSKAIREEIQLQSKALNDPNVYVFGDRLNTKMEK